MMLYELYAQHKAQEQYKRGYERALNDVITIFNNQGQRENISCDEVVNQVKLLSYYNTTKGE